MTDPDIASLFDLLDDWRHLPAYQLERRADIFFALFLTDVLNHHLGRRGIQIDPRLIPEFPLRHAKTKRSDKVDFFALSTDHQHVFLIELKTDMTSLDDKQLDYLKRALARRTVGLLHDVKFMAQARNPAARSKYFHLLKALACLGMVTLPEQLERKIYDTPQGVYECIDAIEIATTLPRLDVILVLPEPKKGWNCIDFETFAGVVEKRGEIGKRFAASLREWTCIKAGSPMGRGQSGAI